MQQCFPGRLQDFPTKYLGTPLSLSRLKRQDEQAVVDGVAACIPTWKVGLLNAVGRATLTKTTLSAIPVHVAICCTLSAWAIAAIDKCRRAFIWAGSTTVAGGKCKVAWTVVCAPRDLGGLGQPDLRILGYALRLRWEWLRRTRPDSAWALLPATAEHCVAHMFNAATSIILGDGATARFWTDDWLPAGPICHWAPVVFASVPSRRRRHCVRDALANRQWTRDVSGATSATFITQFLRVWEMVDGTQLQQDVPDKLVWNLTTDGVYSSSSAYRAFFHGRVQMLGAAELWATAAPPKVKIFFWLALHRRLWTAARRRRHGLQANDDCVLCSQEPETADHLFAACVFTRELWHRLLQRVGFQFLCPNGDADLVNWWLASRREISSGFRKGFDSLVLLISWETWKERNRRTFGGAPSSVAQVLQGIQQEGAEWVSAGFRSLAPLFAP